jgi:hypothetical protein
MFTSNGRSKDVVMVNFSSSFSSFPFLFSFCRMPLLLLLTSFLLSASSLLSYSSVALALSSQLSAHPLCYLYPLNLKHSILNLQVHRSATEKTTLLLQFKSQFNGIGTAENKERLRKVREDGGWWRKRPIWPIHVGKII